ncbi:hemolysin family protein [Paenibacillus septentrionalis]|uniref:Hemolysin family protein n=1 Tax=Paenibacillus septentrionalis TaxID=429342 RepID=A0ABW1UYD0_9BACL
MDTITIINLFILVLLLALTAFFVASEFAVVKIRMSRIDQLIAEGNKKAVLAKKVASDLDYYLSACQLGITVTALGLGALGKPAVERVMLPIFELLQVPAALTSAISYAIAFILVTFLHVVVGEMAPKTLAIQFSEKVTLLLSAPLYWFGKVMYPFIWLLNGTSRTILNSFGIKPAKHEDAYSEEEIKIIMLQSYEGGEINKEELAYMENVFAFDEKSVKEVLVPRTKMVALDESLHPKEILAIMKENNYTRYPVTENNNKDKIIGMLNVKKVLPQILSGQHGNKTELKSFIREIPFVFETTPIKEVMLTMQKKQVHMAVVFDEFGGTSGIVTLEDILEELVGEIRDEFDEDELNKSNVNPAFVK